jgi:hypothetical protein
MTIITRNKLVTCGGGYTDVEPQGEPLQIHQGVLSDKNSDDKPNVQTHTDSAAPLALPQGITGSKQA